jgi:hypothetical protein
MRMSCFIYRTSPSSIGVSFPGHTGFSKSFLSITDESEKTRHIPPYFDRRPRFGAASCWFAMHSLTPSADTQRWHVIMWFELEINLHLSPLTNRTWISATRILIVAAWCAVTTVSRVMTWRWIGVISSFDIARNKSVVLRVYWLDINRTRISAVRHVSWLQLRRDDSDHEGTYHP